MVLQSEGGCRLILSGGHEVLIKLDSKMVAERIWRFTNAANDGAFFNDEHVVAVVPDGDAYRLLFTQGGDLKIPLPAHYMMEGLRSLNQHRNTMAGQP